MPVQVLCTQCGVVDAPRDGRCAACGAADVIDAASEPARRFIERRAARQAAPAPADPSPRAEATGKVLGRALGKLFGK
jgi:predicted ATP-dependent serine protease